mmetsp:Transcript_31760/g.82881  ORF Transcript_31760/g.82881 Transcript_31760/m.82881 type:complete len:105 (-) Transcript_31760:378-692(-)
MWQKAWARESTLLLHSFNSRLMYKLVQGYYDRYFERLRKRGLDPRLIGFCLDEQASSFRMLKPAVIELLFLLQIVKEVPTGEDDACVGAIVTPSRVLACKQDVN